MKKGLSLIGVILLVGLYSGIAGATSDDIFGGSFVLNLTGTRYSMEKPSGNFETEAINRHLRAEFYHVSDGEGWSLYEGTQLSYAYIYYYNEDGSLYGTSTWMMMFDANHHGIMIFGLPGYYIVCQGEVSSLDRNKMVTRVTGRCNAPDWAPTYLEPTDTSNGPWDNASFRIFDLKFDLRKSK